MSMCDKCKSLVRRILFSFGYDVRHVGNYDLLPSIILNNIHPGFFFIQIGANNGRRFDPLFDIARTYDLAGLALEPVSEYFQELQKNYQNSRVVPINKAIYYTNSPVVINKVASSPELPEWTKGVASLNPVHHTKSGIGREHIVQETVEGITFESLLAENKVKNVDLLLIDTEGFDKEIMKMIPFDRISPKIIQFEHNLSVGGMTSDEFVSIISDLVRRGYKICMTNTDCVAHK